VRDVFNTRHFDGENPKIELPAWKFHELFYFCFKCQFFKLFLLFYFVDFIIISFSLISLIASLYPSPYPTLFLGYPNTSSGHVRNRSESVTVNSLNDSTLRVFAGRSRRLRRYLVRYVPHHLTAPTQSTLPSPTTPVDDDNEDDNELSLELDTTPTTTNIITTTTTIPPPSVPLFPTFTHVISTSTPSTPHEHHLVGTVPSPVPTAHHLLLLREPTSLDDAAAGSWQESLNRQRETDARQIESRLMDSVHHHHHHGTAAEAGSIDVARFSHFLQSALTRTRIGYHSSSSSVSSIHAASAAAAGNVASGGGVSNNNGSTSYYSTSSSSYNTSGSANASSSNHSRF
jgi:hypothetical protein